MMFIELYTWNLYEFASQRHLNKFNKNLKKKKKQMAC